MNKSAVVQYQPDGNPADQRTIATGDFAVDDGLASHPIPTLRLSLPFNIPQAGDFVVESIVVVNYGNASLSVRRTTEPAEMLFLAGWGWQTGPNPYFSVRLPAVGTIHIFLQTSPASKPSRRV